MNSLASNQAFNTSLFRTYVVLFSVACVFSILIPRGTDVIFINGLHHPTFDQFFKFITHGGNALILVPVLIWTLFIEFRFSLITLIASALHGLLVFIGKRLLFPGMARPTAVLDHDLLYLIPDVDFHGRYSFPSGHTASIFTATLIIILITKRKDLVIFLLSLSCLVGLSRIYLLQHFLQDVFAGALVGVISAYFSFYLLNENKKWPMWMSQRIKIQLPNLNGKAGSLSTR